VNWIRPNVIGVSSRNAASTLKSTVTDLPPGAVTDAFASW
jgi:hypothetical protein